MPLRRLLLSTLVALGSSAGVATAQPAAAIERDLQLAIVEAEDTRNLSSGLLDLLSHDYPQVRERAALAVGRIGDPYGVNALIPLLMSDPDLSVRAMAAFALGEIGTGGDASLNLVIANERESTAVRSRAIEALGKIIAQVSETEVLRRQSALALIVSALSVESARETPDPEFVVLGLTAALRTRPPEIGPVAARFLDSPNDAIRGAAAGTLARLGLSDGIATARRLARDDPSAAVRANTLRLASTETRAFDLVRNGLEDPDLRVRVTAVRTLPRFAEMGGVAALIARAEELVPVPAQPGTPAVAAGSEAFNELLEIAQALGQALPGTRDPDAYSLLLTLRSTVARDAPEIEQSLARIDPARYISEQPFSLSRPEQLAAAFGDRNRVAAWAAALGEFSSLSAEDSAAAMLRSLAIRNLRSWLAARMVPRQAVPDILLALEALRDPELAMSARLQLIGDDTTALSTAASILATLPPDQESERRLTEALAPALRGQSDEVALSIINALAVQKTPTANAAIQQTALESRSHAVVQLALTQLTANGVSDIAIGNASSRTRNTVADYARALDRVGRTVVAIVSTSRGEFAMRLNAEAAPLTVDNFVQLAAQGYFNGLAFHRVVPNFVVQTGDPRGDGTGGPGYEIRCEVNPLPYVRGAVGMALSGKDTGGSQWFVTHSPQPHLDGGYTVFAYVDAGMDVIDRLVRGDRIVSIEVQVR
jgi:cyclophilin family peptidyl-prolyl cis-trans isomerase/HEAT repeat protein